MPDMPLSIQPTPVFWCEPLGRTRRYLRCYQSNDKREELQGIIGQSLPARAEEAVPKCATWCCNAMRVLDEVDEEWTEHEGVSHKFRKGYDAKDWPFDAFPMICEDCGKEMTKPERQIFCDEIMALKTGPMAGQTFVRRELPVGAMFNIDYYNDIPDWCGRDGLALNVITPGGEWHVDGRANNCTKPEDKAHRCWVRRGDPRTGYCHVDKDATIQETCEAGAGSIWINKGGPRDWHGFLHRGYLCDADDRPKVDAMLDGVVANPVAPAERVLSLPQIDRPVTVRPVRPPPVPSSGWRSNRGFQVRPKR